MREVTFRISRDDKDQPGWFHQWVRTRMALADHTTIIVHKALIETAEGRVVLLDPRAVIFKKPGEEATGGD